MTKHFLKIAIGLVFSVFFLVLALRGVKFTLFLESLHQVRWQTLWPLPFIFLADISLRSWRWAYLLRPLSPVSTKKVFPYMIMGLALNNILPLRLGEVSRAYLLGKNIGQSKIACLSTVFLERLIDLWILAFIFITFVPYQGSPWLSMLRIYARNVLLVAIFLTLFLHPILSRLQRQGNVLSFLQARPKLLSYWTNLLIGLSSFRSIPVAFTILTISAILWLNAAFYFLVVSWAIPEMSGWNLVNSLFTLGLAAFFVAIPSAPGYVGTYEFALMEAAKFNRIPPHAGLTYAVLVHGFNYLAFTSLGVYYLVRHLGLKGIRQAAHEAEKS